MLPANLSGQEHWVLGGGGGACVSEKEKKKNYYLSSKLLLGDMFNEHSALFVCEEVRC